MAHEVEVVSLGRGEGDQLEQELAGRDDLFRERVVASRSSVGAAGIALARLVLLAEPHVEFDGGDVEIADLRGNQDGCNG